MVLVTQGREGPIRWGFTNRLGGVSVGDYASLNLADQVGDDPASVRANRQILAAEFGVPGDRLVVMQACHGTRVSVVTAGVVPEVADVDILITTEPGFALAALAADCLPIVLSDVDSGIVGAVHSGWVGVRDDAVGVAVTAMRDLGARRIHARVGPAICGRCYAVPADRVEQVAATIPEARSTTVDGRPALDLPRAVEARLRRADVAVTVLPVCTAESPTQFSYRRDEITGRHAGVILIAPDGISSQPTRSAGD